VYSVSGVNFNTLTFADIPTTDNTSWNVASANWSATGYRLPTEIEWQWAAMGAMDAHDKVFAGSTGVNNIEDYTWYLNNSDSKTHPAGSMLPNELGLFDMSGNVWEWCWDWYGSYPDGYLADYRGAASGPTRVTRGAGCCGDASLCTVAYRNGSITFWYFYDLGFRVVRP
jgi:formylglycine-generating enzyme required for sulfatase activity